MAHPPPPSGPRTRPVTVSVAVWTQYLTAVVMVLAAIGFLVVKEAVQGEVAKQIQKDPGLLTDAYFVDLQVDWVIENSFEVMAVFYIILALFYAALGLLNNKGNRPGRILTWILSGLALACFSPASLFGRLTGFGAGRTIVPQDSGGLDYSDEANQLVLEATPGWVTALDWSSVALLTIGSLPIIILLALPASNQFFRKKQPGMMPHGGQLPSGPGQPPNTGH